MQMFDCKVPMLCLKDLYTIFFLLCIATLSSGVSPPLNVLNFGAVGDGKTDDSQAFMKAWQALCGAAEASSLIVPTLKTFLLQPLVFEGPCKSSNIHIGIEGNIVAPSTMSGWTNSSKENWIEFLRVDGLIVDGTGQIDGQGADWWKNCGTGKSCPRPNELKFEYCGNLTLSGLKLINSPRAHVSIYHCTGATISKLTIVSPETSPNTDGIDIGHSTNVIVHDCNIGAGDDCIAVESDSSFINITSVTCGPGHGISIGSIGYPGETDTVEEVHVKNCTFSSTENGARVKTWQGGTGYARKISFQDMRLIETKNPIIIDQYYCPNGACNSKTISDIKISEVSFTGFRGTSATEIAINLNCSQIGCTGIVLDHNNITSAVSNKPVTSYCLHAHGTVTNTFPPVTLPS